ncbi:MAG: winged helix-turn-helix transcriptional regulator [Solirubrobacterales bacterium]|nr:winged helix-turn-helix transcriptional regulator [Solirubrobacterales bacterium]
MTEDRCDLLCLDLPLAESIRERLDTDDAERAAEQAKALGDPTRVTAARALREGGELCVCDLAWILGRSENLVSHHVRLLRQAGLAQSRRDGKMVLYSLTDVGAALLDSLMAVPGSAK